MRARRGAQASVVSDAGPEADAQHWVTARFEAVGERLAARRDSSDACVFSGRELARDGADLAQALDGLRTISARVLGTEPPFAAVRALSLPWSEETLGYLHQLSCENVRVDAAARAWRRDRADRLRRR